MFKPAQRKRPIYLFDLDNTLFNANLHVFPRMNQHINAYLMCQLALDEVAANQLRLRYWRRYGSTLRGLMTQHTVDPLDYLTQVHPETLVHEIGPDRGLRQMLLALPGRKFVFTNSLRSHAERVLIRLGVSDLFEDIFDVVATGFHGKPQIEAYRRVLRHIRVPARHCIMVEDTLENLQTAKRLGMGTVYIHAGLRRGRCADQRWRRVQHMRHWR